MNAASPNGKMIIKFPVRIDIGDRTFNLPAVDTRTLWALYAEYESLIMGLVPTEENAVPSMSKTDAKRTIDMMIELCELCEEGQLGKVVFDNRFQPGDDTPMILMEKVAETLFGPFLRGSGQGSYQPLIQRLSQPLVNSIEGS